MSKGSSNSIKDLFLGTSLVFLFIDLFINYRLWSQSNNIFEVDFIIFDSFLTTITRSAISLFSFAGGYEWSLLLIKAFCLFSFAVYVFLGKPSVKDERPSGWIYFLALVGTFSFFLTYLFSPYYLTLKDREILLNNFLFSVSGTFVSYLIISYSYGIIGRCLVYGGNAGMKSDMQADPFGHKERFFKQQPDKIENEYSVNIPYKFYNEVGKLSKGWINFINPFRGVQVLGTPGSGKSYTFFLAAIDQMIEKGFSMLIYDFKYPDLSRYSLNCLEKHRNTIADRFQGVVPDFSVITFDKVLESERCNVLQPHLWKDFTIDAYGQANVFLIALNRSWSTKEGDFFPESAKNICAAGMWALKIYKGGKYCTLPHLIEFLSMDTKSIVKCLIALKDISLRNVIKPFEEALEGAEEQLQGQMGTIRIALSRLSSPSVYWITTEAPNEDPMSLEINLKKKPKILCLGSSSANQVINNIFFSLYISQIFRIVNVKDRRKLGVILDEVTTLSFSNKTLDTILATGRSNLISVWLGYQDLSQLIRDFTKDVGEALFKVIGNTVSGNVEDDTADRMMKRIGKMRIMKKSMSISTEGEPSFSFSENYDFAVPESFFGAMSQGTFAGKVADNFDEKVLMKSFYGESAYKPPFNDENQTEKINITPFWKKKFEENCNGESDSVKKKFAESIMQSNFNTIVKDVENMKKELLET